MSPRSAPAARGRPTTRGRWPERLPLLVIALVLAGLGPLVVFLWPAQAVGAGAGDDWSYPTARMVSAEFDGCADVPDEVPCGQGLAVLDESGRQVEALLHRDAWYQGIEAGDAVVLFRSTGVDGAPVHASHSPRRGGTMLLFAGATALLVALCVGARGLKALLSLALAAAFVWSFLVGGVAAGGSPLVYASVGAPVVLTLVLFATHGPSLKTTAAWLGTTTGVLVALLLGWWMSDSLRLGSGDGTAQDLQRVLPGLDLPSLASAALLLVLIGVLNDVSAAQASTVFSHAAEARRDEREPLDAAAWDQVVASSLVVGRDHAASAVYTVVFSVLGAGMAGLVLSRALGVGTAALVQSDAVATVVVQVLAGMAGTAVAMRATTSFAVALARGFGSGHEGTRARRHAH